MMGMNMKYKAISILDYNMNTFHMMSGLILSLSVGCAQSPAEYQYGFSLSDIEFSYFDSTEGVYPSQTTFSNPINPFTHGAPSKWDIESAGYPQASFYSWATTLALEPTGEHQFYTANALHNIYEQDLCKREECYFVHAMTLAAYKAQLNSFPYSVSYTADGLPFPIDTIAYDSILSLGGTVDNWTKTTDSEGNEILIPKETP